MYVTWPQGDSKVQNRGSEILGWAEQKVNIVQGTILVIAFTYGSAI